VSEGATPPPTYTLLSKTIQPTPVPDRQISGILLACIAVADPCLVA